MSELITQQVFTDGQLNINASDMNGIIGKATVQPDIIANKPASATMDIADTFLVLKTDNTLAQSRFDTIVNSTSSALPLADTTKNGMLRQLSGNASDYVGGDNQCHQLVPTGTVWDTLASTAPAGWLLLNGNSYPTATYPALFALIGYTYGGSGANFNVPDARGRATIGAGTGAGLSNRVLGTSLGNETVALVTANLPAHAHPITDVSHTHATVSHNHSDPGHNHAVSAGIIGMNNPIQGVPVTGGATFYTPQAITIANNTCGLGAAAPNTDARFTGITTTQNAVTGGSGSAHGNMMPSLVVNKMVKV
jgi:microcystin-dependent protein